MIYNILLSCLSLEMETAQRKCKGTHSSVIFFILQEGTKDTKKIGKQSVCYTTEIWAINAKETILSRKEATHIPVVVPIS